MRPARQTIFVVLLLLFAVNIVADEARVGWMVYPYVLDKRMSEEGFRRLLGAKDVDYVGIQLFLGSKLDPLVKQRAHTLATAGKRIILQIWWGPSGAFPWERYNLPAIAMEREIRREFFTKGVDALLNDIGPKNIYAAHLLEESGMQFGFDIDIPGNPARDDDGYDNGNSYDNPANWVWRRGISGPNVLTIRRYNDRFRRETGLDMGFYPVWTPKQEKRYRRWVAQRFEAGAHIAFKEHAAKAHPHLRVYAFNSGYSLVPQSKYLDGQFTDPYSDTIGVYMSMRLRRILMRPNQELIGMVWGNRQLDRHPRLVQMAACYAAGCNVLSTFGDKETANDEWMNRVRATVKPFIGRPVVMGASPLLVLTGGALFSATLRNCQFWITGFAHYDVADKRTMEAVDLGRYKMIFAWGLEHPKLAEWVRAGGVLVSVRPGKDFLAREGILAAAADHGKRETIDYHPKAHIKKRLELAERYRLELQYVAERKVLAPAKVQKDRFLYVVDYGKGLIVTIPALCYVHAPWKYEPFWEDYRKLLVDVCRGALAARGLRAVANTCFDDPARGNDYLRVPDDKSGQTIYVLLTDTHGGNRSKTSFVIPGLDLVSGRRNVRFCHDNPVVIVEESGQ